MSQILIRCPGPLNPDRGDVGPIAALLLRTDGACFCRELLGESFNRDNLDKAVRENLLHHPGTAATPSRRRSDFLSAAFRCWLTVVLSVLLFTGCKTVPPIKDAGPHTRLIHVTSNGWHTAIVVPAPALVTTGAIPELEDFSGAAFLEFGWGDRTYYPANKKTLGMTLTAVLVPTPAVMHLAGHQAPPRDDTGYDLISVELTEDGFRRLAKTLAAEFERPPGGRAEPISRGIYPRSHFYGAHGDFHLFNTCNTWTARMLSASGVALSPSGIVMADKLMTRLRAALAVE